MEEDHVKAIVLLGGSAGSLEVILKLLPDLPVMGACYVVVVHRRSDHDTMLAELLARRTTMRVIEVEDKEPIFPDIVYLAPPGYHLLVEDRTLFSLDASEKVHFSRPSIDATFESAAAVFGTDTIAVLLSGANADGADGLKTVRIAGGLALVQSPETAEVAYMPEQAILIGASSHVVAPDEIPAIVRERLQT